MKYLDFLNNKRIKSVDSGFIINTGLLNPLLFDWQKVVVRWALKKGKSAIFADCGLGKTFIQLEWSDKVLKNTGRPVLILAPLAVACQTKREGEKLGVRVNICRCGNDIINGVNITNYEMLEHFSGSGISGIVLDESSILKSFTGKFKCQIIEKFRDVPYKLACTATPSPNDNMELGNHAEFLNVMSRNEMLATYFIHDSGDTAKWRLKGHAQSEFWKWVSTWAATIKKPSDIGFDDTGYNLPKLIFHEQMIESEPEDGMLIAVPAKTLAGRRAANYASIDERVGICAEIVNNSNEIFVVWCNYNIESERLTKSIRGAVEIAGTQKPEHKENAMDMFSRGEIKCLVTKPKIAGFGMNWQNCSNMIFCGMSDSYEQFYQAVRRCYRFGQTRDVNVHVVLSEKESEVIRNIKRKEADMLNMSREMVKNASDIVKREISESAEKIDDYRPTIQMTLPDWLGVAK